MATRRQQLNIRVPEGLARKIRMLSTFHSTSVNEWAVTVLQEAVDQEFAQHPVEELTQELARVAQRYLPGRAVDLEEMLALADQYAEDDVADGMPTRHVTSPRDS